MSQVIQLAGGRQATYEVLGRGEPLLWFQGGPGLPASLLRHDAELLADRYTSYLIDPHGSGGSTPPADPEDYSPEGHARYYDEVRQALGLGTVSLLGFSFGGGVALAYAASFPQVTRRCMTVGAFAVGVEHVAAQAEAQMTRALARHTSAPWYPEAYAVLERWTERVLAATDHTEVDAMLATVAPFYFAHPERPAMAEYIAAFRRDTVTDLCAIQTWEAGLYQRADLRHLFARIHCSLLVIAGDVDFIGGLPQAQAIWQGVPQASLAVVPDCGHFVFAESPTLFRQMVIEWMVAAEHTPQS
jgi:pimeloyl-ACP methyl ester carboxylesterase